MSAAHLRCEVKRGVAPVNKNLNCRKCNDLDKARVANEKAERMLLDDDDALELIVNAESSAESKRLFELGKIAARTVNDEKTWPTPIKK